MNRRAFIAGSAGGLFAVAPAVATAAESRSNRVPPSRIATYVANLRDYGGRTGVPATGARLTLIRVRDRNYDPLSVAVLAEDGRHLGYLPPDHGRVLAPLMDAGLRFSASVTQAAGGRTPRLDIGIELVGMGDTV